VSEAPDTVRRFSGLADRYDRYRPGYPPEAIAAILAGLPPHAVVADVGAGTGISTRALREAGAAAFALEPNDEMRAFAGDTGVEIRAGSAEATGLGARSVDAVTCFQAFHWFANAAAVREFARVLRPGGRLAIVWNERDLADAFSAGFRDIEQRYSPPDLLAGAHFKDERLEPLLREGGFTNVRLRTFANAQRLDREATLGRMRSTSYAPREGPDLERMTHDLLALFERCRDDAGHVFLRYVTEVWTAEPENA
jgi:SAM-dependent methyltransferase